MPSELLTDPDIFTKPKFKKFAAAMNDKYPDIDGPLHSGGEDWRDKLLERLPAYCQPKADISETAKSFFIEGDTTSKIQVILNCSCFYVTNVDNLAKGPYLKDRSKLKPCLSHGKKAVRVPWLDNPAQSFFDACMIAGWKLEDVGF